MKLNEEEFLEEIVQKLARKCVIRWEEMQLKNASNDQLIKAKEMIENELKARSKNV